MESAEMCSCSDDVQEFPKKVDGYWEGGTNKWYHDDHHGKCEE